MSEGDGYRVADYLIPGSTSEWGWWGNPPRPVRRVDGKLVYSDTGDPVFVIDSNLPEIE